MRPIVLSILLVATACAPRDPSLLGAPAENAPERTIVQNAGFHVNLDQTSNEAAVVASEVPVDPEALWRALPAAFADVGLRGAGVIDEEDRVFGFPDAVIPSRLSGSRLSMYLNCGQSPAGANADHYRVTGSVLAAVRPGAQAGKAVVELAIEAIGKPRNVSGAPVRCRSNGRLEQEIAQKAMVRAAIDS